MLPFPLLFTAAFDHPIISAPCRCPKAPTIFVVNHRDGLARFDRLEWPWQRHKCAQTVDTDFGLDFIARQLNEEQHDWIKLAFVAGAKQLWLAGKPLLNVQTRSNDIV